MKKIKSHNYIYPIAPGTQTREVVFHNWSDNLKKPYIGAFTVIDHTGYKIIFSAEEMEAILKMIKRQNDTARNK